MIMSESKKIKPKLDPTLVMLALPDDVAFKYKFIMQPNRITNATMPYNGRQIDAFVTIVSKVQFCMEQQLSKGIGVEQLELFSKSNQDSIQFEIPIKEFNVTAPKYAKLKQDLINMAVIPVKLPVTDPQTGEKYILASGFYKAYIPERYGRAVKISIDRNIAKLLVDIKDGYTRYDSEVVLRQKQSYAKRMYMLISGWKTKGGMIINIDRFKEIIGVAGKYSDYKDFHRWIIKPCQEKLKTDADCWFEVSPDYRTGEKQPYQLRFKIISIPTTPIEKRRFQTQLRLLENILYQMGLKGRTCESILKEVHVRNIVSALDKAHELLKIEFKRFDIVDKDAYFLKAMLDHLNGKILK